MAHHATGYPCQDISFVIPGTLIELITLNFYFVLSTVTHGMLWTWRMLSSLPWIWSNFSGCDVHSKLCFSASFLSQDYPIAPAGLDHYLQAKCKQFVVMPLCNFLLHCISFLSQHCAPFCAWTWLPF